MTPLASLTSSDLATSNDVYYHLILALCSLNLHYQPHLNFGG